MVRSVAVVACSSINQNQAYITGETILGEGPAEPG